MEDQHDLVEIQKHLSVDPYDDKTPRELLSRKYLIYNQELSDLVRHVLYPEALLQEVPGVKHCVKGFKYFRSDIELEVLVTTNSHVYGTFLVSAVPFQDPAAATAQYGQVSQQIQANGKLLDLNRQESIKIHLPYLYPQRLRKVSDLPTARQWLLSLQTLHLDTLTAVTKSEFNVQIWASYVDPKLAGFVGGQFQSALPMTTRDLLTQPSRFSRAAAALGAAASTSARSFLDAASSALPGVAASVAPGSNLFKAMENANKNTSVKQQMCPDLNGDGASILPIMGDLIRGDKFDLPSVGNEFDIRELCEIPSYAGSEFLADLSDELVISLDAARTYSYLSYFRRLFKYVRYDTKIMIRVATSQEVSAKLSFVLKPVGGANGALGDLPNWEKTVRGTTDFSIVVPYMEADHWMDFTAGQQLGSLRVSLMSVLPQLFDKPVGIFVTAFVSPVNLHFGGYQSPCNTAQMQSEFADQFGEAITFGDSYISTYMGGYRTVYDLLKRYSSRDVNPQNMFPFPRQINTEMYKYDTYDYLAQLYAFYTGSVDVKYGFTKAPTAQLIKMVVGNSNGTSVHGTSNKAGNSMILTSQSIWPMVELNFPYERLNEFDSLADPSAHFVPEVNDISTVSDILIRPGADFSFFTRLPTPDWADDFAVFQSAVPKYLGVRVNTFSVPLTGLTRVSHTLSGTPLHDATCHVDLDVYVVRNAGTEDFQASVGLRPTLTPPVNFSDITYSSVLGVRGFWTDITNSGKNLLHMKASGAITGYGTDWTLYFGIDKDTVESTICGTLTFRPYGGTTIPLTPGGYGSTIIVNTDGNPLAVSGEVYINGGEPQPVTIVNEPLPVLVANESPIEVHVQGGELVVTGDVTVSGGTINIDGDIPVYGSENPERPVWITSYET